MQPVELVSNSETPGELAFVTGWGRDNVKVNLGPSIRLRGATVSIIDRNKCNKTFGNDVTERMLCAGDDGKSCKISFYHTYLQLYTFLNVFFPSYNNNLVCPGDIGGPLVKNGTKELIGVASWGDDCTKTQYPGVYARVASVRSWIKEIANV